MSEVWATPLLSAHLAGGRHLRIAMYSPEFKSFLEHLYPALRRANLSFAIVTAMEDYSMPWEEFVCRPASSLSSPSSPSAPGVSREDQPRSSDHKAPPGARLRHFLSDPLLVHWYTQNLDLYRSAGKRLNYIGPSEKENACTQRIGTVPQFDSDFSSETDGPLLAKVSSEDEPYVRSPASARHAARLKESCWSFTRPAVCRCRRFRSESVPTPRDAATCALSVSSR